MQERVLSLSNEIHDHQVKYHMCEDEIGKCSLGSDSAELAGVLRVHLESQAHWNVKHHTLRTNNIKATNHMKFV